MGDRTENIIRIRDYVGIARPDHWLKNAFMLPGAAMAFIIDDRVQLTAAAFLVAGIIATCLLASANYTINEYLDGKFDRHHPTKSSRPAAQGKIRLDLMLTQYVILAGAGLAIASQLNPVFFLASLLLLFMGIVYNVEPLRTKDRVFLDVLSESVNNPIRLILGWAAITTIVMPPSRLLICYWAGGAYLMTVKRYAEYRMIADAERAAAARAPGERVAKQVFVLDGFERTDGELELAAQAAEYRLAPHAHAQQFSDRLRVARARGAAGPCAVVIGLAVTALTKNQMIFLPAAFWLAGCLLPVAGLDRRRLAVHGAVWGAVAAVVTIALLEGSGIGVANYLASYRAPFANRSPLAAKIMNLGTELGLLWLLLPQLVLFAAAALRIRDAEGTAPSFVIPSGNLGLATACAWARGIGLPVGAIVLAHNANRTVPDFLADGQWRPRASIATLASAMDVGDPSNMERLMALYPGPGAIARPAGPRISTCRGCRRAPLRPAPSASACAGG